MTSSGSTRPEFGTRFEFTLRESDATRALYDCVVYRATEQWQAVLELTPTSAKVVSRDETLEETALTQLVSLGKNLGRHAEGGVWPRRILRWRQPGVR